MAFIFCTASSITPVRHDDIIGVIVNQKSFAIFSWTF